MMLQDTAMVVVNFVGLVLQFSYVVMFYYYASAKVSFFLTILILLL